jgi:hypothetical protein
MKKGGSFEVTTQGTRCMELGGDMWKGRLLLGFERPPKAFGFYKQ